MEQRNDNVILEDDQEYLTETQTNKSKIRKVKSIFDIKMVLIFRAKLLKMMRSSTCKDKLDKIRYKMKLKLLNIKILILTRFLMKCYMENKFLCMKKFIIY